MTRKFVGWDRSLLWSVADDLIAAHRADSLVDLRELTCVFPVSRAGRRFLEILVLKCEEKGIGLLPPRIISVGELADLLLPGTYRFAPQFERFSAWIQALKSVTEHERLLIIRPKEDPIPLSYLIAVARRLDSLSSELGGALLLPKDIGGDLPPDAPPSDEARWQAIHSVFERYYQLLEQRGFSDRHRAIASALERRECLLEGTLVLFNTIDLTHAARLMIRDLPSVIAYVMAPEELSNSFDDVGCCLVEKWRDRHFQITDPLSSGGLTYDRVIVVEFDRDQASAVASVLSERAPERSASEVTLGVCQSENASIVGDVLSQYGIPVRNASGRPFLQTRLGTLISEIVTYVRGMTGESFRALCRHPDIETWLTRRINFDPPLLIQLDEFHCEYLEATFEIQKPPQPVSNFVSLLEVSKALTNLFKPLFGEGRASFPEWSSRLHRVISEILVHDDASDSASIDEREWECWTTLLETIMQEGGDAFTSLVQSDAFSLLQVLMRDGIIKPAPAQDAIDIVGWLELVLDDAPVLVITDLNEGVVPESVNEDAFLPNTLRTRHGLLDNDRRFARDACALAMIVRSRPDTTVIVPRYGTRGEILPPSRLLLHCQPERLSERLKLFMEARRLEERESQHSPGAAIAVMGPKRPENILPTTRVNVTSLREYIECPYRFYLRRVCKVSSMNDTDREMSPPVFGNLAHGVLATLKESPAGRSSNPDEVTEHLLSELSRRVSQQFGSWAYATALVQVEQLRQRLIQFAKWQASHVKDGWSIRDVELAVPEGSVTLSTSRGAVSLVGRIDRIDVHADGTLCIFDYKTGEASLDKMFRVKKQEWRDPQLVAYRLMLKRLGEKASIKVGLISVGRELDTIGSVVAGWDESIFESGESSIHAIVESIASGVFWPPAASPKQFSDLQPFFIGYQGEDDAG